MLAWLRTMRAGRPRSENRPPGMRASSPAFLRLVIAGLGLLITLPVLAADLPSLPKAKAGTSCIEAPATMRRNHPDMLKHQRDDTLRLGIRGAKSSLKDCVACHSTANPEGKPVPVDAEGQFCQACHSYAAVKPDCFACHATTPPIQEASR